MNEVELRSKIERDLRDYPNWDMSRKRTYAAMMYAMYHSDEPSPSLNSIIDQSLEKTIAGFRSENRSSDLNMVMVLKEIVDRDLHDLDQEIEDWQKSAMDFERDFEVALRNGQQRQLAERINRVREPETREKMGKAIEELKQRVHDEMEELDVEHEQWEREQEAERARREARRAARRQRIRRQPEPVRRREVERLDRQEEREDANEDREQTEREEAFEEPRKTLVTLEELEGALDGLNELTFPDEPVHLPEADETTVEEEEQPEPEVIVVEDEKEPTPLPEEQPVTDDDQRRQKLFDQLYKDH